MSNTETNELKGQQRKFLNLGTTLGFITRASSRATLTTATFLQSWAASARGRATTWRTAIRWHAPMGVTFADQTFGPKHPTLLFHLWPCVYSCHLLAALA
eukprot:3882870-Pleurochrysis_carterae.AAC.8